MDLNNVSVVVENLKKIFQKKSDTEVADVLTIPRTSLSTIKSRNAIGTMFEKIATIEKSISLDAIFLAKDDQEVECYSLANKAVLIAQHDPVKLQELSDLLEHYITINNTLKMILPLIQTIKGKNFITKLSEMWTGNGERMLIVLSRYLSYLQTITLDMAYPKENFLNALKQFDSYKIKLPFFDDIDTGIISEQDRARLILWAETNLDDVSCYDMITANSKILEVVNNELNILNNAVLKKTGMKPTISVR